MPQTLIDPNKTSKRLDHNVINADYDYAYPGGMNLKPGSTLHNKIRDIIIQTANGSSQEIKKRFDGWKEVDRKLTSFIPTDSAALRGIKNKDLLREDSRTPVDIVIPISYAVLDTLMTYLVAAFLEEPYFRYEGVGPEDMLGAILLEMTIANQCRRAKVGLELHTMWRNGLAYGMAPVHIGWETVLGQRTVRKEETVYSRLRNALIGGGVSEEMMDVVLYDGSTLTALDPYMCLPDPNTPIHDIQGSESFGWIEDTNLMALLAQEKSNPDNIFNMKYVNSPGIESIFVTFSL